MFSIFSFMRVIKFYYVTRLRITFRKIIIVRTLPSRIHWLGSVTLVHLGETFKLPSLPLDIPSTDLYPLPILFSSV